MQSNPRDEKISSANVLNPFSSSPMDEDLDSKTSPMDVDPSQKYWDLIEFISYLSPIQPSSIIHLKDLLTKFSEGDLNASPRLLKNIEKQFFNLVLNFLIFKIWRLILFIVFSVKNYFI